MGWKASVWAVEVGARGYVAASTRSCFLRLGLSRAKVKKLCKEASDTALRWSFWIWLGREKAEWFSPNAGGIVSGVRRVSVMAGQELCGSVKKSGNVNAPVVTTGATAGGTDEISQDIDFQVEVLRKEASGSHSGLKNIGNSCYISAVMQCLARVDGLNNGAPGNAQGSDLVVEYERLVSKSKVKSGRTITPSHFKRALAKLDSRF